MSTFKIELESVITSDGFTKTNHIVMDLNHVIAISKIAKNLNDLNDLIGHTLCVLKYGLSGSHLWVSYPNGYRILLITENGKPKKDKFNQSMWFNEYPNPDRH